MKIEWAGTERKELGMPPAAMDLYLRQCRQRMSCPFVFSRNILNAAKKAGLDVDKLKADGVLVETQRIPTGGTKGIWIAK